MKCCSDPSSSSPGCCNKWIKGIFYACLGLFVFTLSIFVVLYHFQAYFFYHPNTPSDSRETIRTPDAAGFPSHEILTLIANDGTNLVVYWMPFSNPKKNKKGAKANKKKLTTEPFPPTDKTIIFFQGSSGNIGHRLPKMARLMRIMSSNILMPSYRGFGRSEGAPDEEGIIKDAQAALDFVISNRISRKTKIIFWGESFGSSVAIDLASRNTRPHSIILENPYLNLRSTVALRLPWGMKWLSRFVKEKWDNEDKMSLLTDAASTTGHMSNILFMTGMQDKIVPANHGAELAKIAEKGKELANKPKNVKIELVTFSRGGHLDLAEQAGFYESINKFLEKKN